VIGPRDWQSPARGPAARASRIASSIAMVASSIIGPNFGLDASIFRTVPESSIPSQSVGASCDGLDVPAGTNLRAIMESHASGTTYCLAAGTFEVTSTIDVESGDRVLGAGREATFIDGSPIPQTNGRIFMVQGRTTFADLDVSGARTPPDSSTTCINASGETGPTSCGKAFVNNGELLTLQSVDCHDNGANCVSGAGSLVMDDVDCWNNGSPYSMTQGQAYAACVKIAAAYTQGSGSLTLTSSYIHDQPGNGIWCDFCKFGSWRIEGNRFVHNGNHAIQWEMSGGWTADDHALVRNNVFHDNGWQTGKTGPGGIIVSTANDIVIEDNTFGGQTALHAYAVYILFSTSRGPPQTDSVGVVVRNNELNGDAILGCGRPSLVEYLYSERARLSVGLLLLLAAIVTLGVMLRRRLGMWLGVLLGLGVAVCVLLAIGLALLPVGTGATCINNA
jgi:hypothetical protein